MGIPRLIALIEAALASASGRAPLSDEHAQADQYCAAALWLLAAELLTVSSPRCALRVR